MTERELLIETRDALCCLVNRIEEAEEPYNWAINVPEKEWIEKILTKSTEYLDNL